MLLLWRTLDEFSESSWSERNFTSGNNFDELHQMTEKQTFLMLVTHFNCNIRHIIAQYNIYFLSGIHPKSFVKVQWRGVEHNSNVYSVNVYDTCWIWHICHPKKKTTLTHRSQTSLMTFIQFAHVFYISSIEKWTATMNDKNYDSSTRFLLEAILYHLLKCTTKNLNLSPVIYSCRVMTVPSIIHTYSFLFRSTFLRWFIQFDQCQCYKDRAISIDQLNIARNVQLN